MITEYTDVVPFDEASRRLGIGRASLYRAFKNIDPETGRIEAAKFGGDIIGSRRIIRRPGFERYIACLETPAPAPGKADTVTMLHKLRAS